MQARQIFAFGLQHMDSGVAITSSGNCGGESSSSSSSSTKSIASGGGEDSNADRRANNLRNEELTRMLKRSFGLFKPLARWRDLKFTVQSRNYSDTAHRHFFHHMLMLV